MKALNILAPCLVLLLMSCQQVDQSSGPHWVQVDESRVKDAVKKMIAQQNTKDDELRAEYDLAQQNKDLLRAAKNELEHDERDRCYNIHEPKLSSQIIIDKGRAAPSMRISGDAIGGKPVERKPVDVCIDAINDMESIKTLREKMDALDAVSKNKDRYEREMSRLAEEVANESIQAFSRQSGYDLVLKRRDSGTILYIKNKLAIDATESVIDFIERSKPDLTVKYYAEGGAQ